MATPAEPVFAMPVKADDDDTTENPWRVLLEIFAVVPEVPPVFKMPVVTALEALL